MANNTVNLCREVRDIMGAQNKLYSVPANASVVIEGVTIKYYVKDEMEKHKAHMTEQGYSHEPVCEGEDDLGLHIWVVCYTR